MRFRDVSRARGGSGPRPWDRRSLLASGVALGLGPEAVARAAPSPPAAAPLKTIAQSKGLRFGTAMGLGSLTEKTGALFNPAYRALVADQCDIIVPENALKMYAIEPRANAFNFAPAQALLQFADDHAMAMRGHNLLWARDEYTPAWVKAYDFGPTPRAAAEALLSGYIDKVTRHFGDRLTSWDVVNEAVDPKTGQLRAQAFTRILGLDALKIAFQAARRNLPKTQLVYNDYMGWGTGDQTHRDGVLALLRWFRQNDVPVDALGVQSHLSATSKPDHQAWKMFIDQVVALGYGLLISEFDVDDRDLKGDQASCDQKIAAVTQTYMDMMLSYRPLKDVLVWGLSDQYSWLRTLAARSDGHPLRPTPYDTALHAKPMREAIAASLAAAPER